METTAKQIETKAVPKKAVPKKAVPKKVEKATDKVLFTFRVEPQTIKDLEMIAKKRNTTPAAIIRTAMASYVKSTKKLGRV
jgi:hypothetical protein